MRAQPLRRQGQRTAGARACVCECECELCIPGNGGEREINRSLFSLPQSTSAASLSDKKRSTGETRGEGEWRGVRLEAAFNAFALGGEGDLNADNE